jgi:hypothetical protein
MIGQLGPKHVGAIVLNTGILIKLCVFGGSNCNNLILMQGIENVKKENVTIFPRIIYLLVL